MSNLYAVFVNMSKYVVALMYKHVLFENVLFQFRRGRKNSLASLWRRHCSGIMDSGITTPITFTREIPIPSKTLKKSPPKNSHQISRPQIQSGNSARTSVARNDVGAEQVRAIIARREICSLAREPWNQHALVGCSTSKNGMKNVARKRAVQKNLKN